MGKVVAVERILVSWGAMVAILALFITMIVMVIGIRRGWW